jgi:hypothetical protein
MVSRLDSLGALVRHRLGAQGLTTEVAPSAGDVIARMGAIQAENVALTPWSLSIRTGLDRAAIEAAIHEGTILRLHLLRPTWHFVHRDDLLWMQRLSGPRAETLNARRYADLELTPKLRSRALDIIVRSLEGGHLTRAELGTRLAAASIQLRSDQLAHVMFHAEITCAVCSGVPRGGEQTYALVTERANAAVPFEGDAALAELARRYFTTRGPATERDFRWWSGLSAALSKRGIEGAKVSLASTTWDGRTYFFGDAPAAARRAPVMLLPALDEYLIAYTDSRDVALGGRESGAFGDRGLMHWVVRNGEVAGRWRLVRERDRLRFEIGGLDERLELSALESVAARCAKFFGRPADLIAGDAYRPRRAARRPKSSAVSARSRRRTGR